MKFFISLLALLVLVGGPVAVLAAPTPVAPTPGPTPVAPTPGAEPVAPTPGAGGGLQNPLKDINSLPDLLNAILKAVVELGSIILVVAIVYVGFKFVVAQGNEEKIKEARGALVWTVIGGLILLGATAISTVIQATVGGLQ